MPTRGHTNSSTMEENDDWSRYDSLMAKYTPVRFNTSQNIISLKS